MTPDRLNRIVVAAIKVWLCSIGAGLGVLMITGFVVFPVSLWNEGEYLIAVVSAALLWPMLVLAPLFIYTEGKTCRNQSSTPPTSTRSLGD